VTIGAATITGTAAGYAPGVGNVTVAIAASFNPSPLNVVAGQTAQTTLTLAQPAPAGGITVNLTTNDATRATVASPVVIPAGQVSGVVTVTGVNVGTTGLTASGLGLVTTGLTVIVGNPPAITVNAASLGKDLQQSVGFSLAAPAPAGNLVVTLTSSDPSKLLLATSASSAGTPSVTVTVAAGQSIGNFFAQALDSTGTPAVNATAPGYANGQGTMTLRPSGFYIVTTDFTTGAASANTGISVCAARLLGNVFQAQQQVRGGLTVNIAMTSSAPGSMDWMWKLRLPDRAVVAATSVLGRRSKADTSLDRSGSSFGRTASTNPG